MKAQNSSDNVPVRAQDGEQTSVNPQSKPLRLLVVEDSPRDAELVAREIRRGGFDLTWKRVDTEAAMKAALDAEPWDAVVSDYCMPHFDGLQALRVLQASGLDMPFIIVSGTIGEEAAVAAMQAGAHDYLMKDKLTRLAPVIERELRDAASRGERHRAEVAFYASEVRYRRLFESAKDGILILDAETGLVVDVNPFLIELLGYSREAFLDKKVWELGFLKDLFANQSNFKELQQKGYVRYDDMALQTSDGQRVEVEFVSNVYVAGREKVVQCNIRDVTKRKQADEALRESQRLTERLINAISVRVFWKNKNLVYLGCNTAFARDAGFADPQDVIGKDDSQMAWSNQAERYQADDLAVVESGASKLLIEEPQTTPSGKIITLLTSKIPLLSSDGKIIGLLGTYIDITEQRQLESQFRQAQKMEAVGRLAGGVAHDFNNLLMAIMGYTHLCREKIAPDHPIREWLDQITRASEKSAEITRQLLAFARKQTIAPKVLDLNDAVAGMLKLLRQLIGEDVKLTWRPGADLRSIKIDPSQVDQILANLCVNARDAIAGVGEITLETGNIAIDSAYCAKHSDGISGAYVFLAVSDNGCGMDSELLAKIFEPFFTTKSIGKGTGLGLATVYGIIKQNHGFIHTDSEPGKGTTFKLYLPQVEGGTVDAPETGGLKVPKARGETVLLVEDEKSLCDICGRFLEELGYKVLVAETPEAALTLTARHSGTIQLLLTDVVMPRMDGRQLAKRLASTRPELKVLFMSGYTSEVIAQRGVLDEGVHFISKPFTINELARKVRQVLEEA